MLEHDPEKIPDDSWVSGKIRSAIGLRRSLSIPSDSYRLVFSEADSLPGLTVDLYGRIAVCQFHTAWVDKNKHVILETLNAELSLEGILEKNDEDIRKAEGLPAPSPAVLSGKVPDSLIIEENGLRFEIFPRTGQKTGWYLDQRDSRRLTASFAADREVLDCFSNAAGFAAPCLKAGAKSVLRLDSSRPALDTGTRNLGLNGLNPSSSPDLCGNAFEELRKFRDRAISFDMIILDPPGLAPTRAGLPKAMRALKDLHLLGLKLLRPGGILVSFSCSSAVTRQDLIQSLQWAEQDCGRRTTLLLDFGQPPDHPRLPGFPPSDYLKGFLGRVP
jgi:23S rRNA (cytosine1962-C5)-methyltransferase